jgi:integrase
MSSEKVLISDIVQMLLDRYKAEGRVGTDNARNRLRFFKEWFGGWKVIQFTSDRAWSYAVRRREMKAAISTVNAELSFLKRAFSIAIESGRLGYAPRIRMIPGAHKRFGIISDEDLARIMAGMKPHHRAPIEFLRLTGWREMECLKLEVWRCDWAHQQIRLDNSKTGAPRTVPWTTYPALRDVLEAQKNVLDAFQAKGIIVSHVFPDHDGKPMSRGVLTQAWHRARVKVIAPSMAWARHDGQPGLPMIHDLRRTLNTEMDMAGVPWSVQKVITGHASNRVHHDYQHAPRKDVEEGLSKLGRIEPLSNVVGFPSKP